VKLIAHITGFLSNIVKANSGSKNCSLKQFKTPMPVAEASLLECLAANTANAYTGNGGGGGVTINNGCEINCTVRGSTFVDNLSYGYGGGLYAQVRKVQSMHWDGHTKARVMGTHVTFEVCLLQRHLALHCLTACRASRGIW
jgi:hypothetical protein